MDIQQIIETTLLGFVTIYTVLYRFEIGYKSSLIVCNPVSKSMLSFPSIATDSSCLEWYQVVSKYETSVEVSSILRRD